MMVPDTRQRLEAALADLQSYVVSVQQLNLGCALQLVLSAVDSLLCVAAGAVSLLAGVAERGCILSAPSCACNGSGRACWPQTCMLRALVATAQELLGTCCEMQ
mgnify:FL=1